MCTVVPRVMKHCCLTGTSIFWVEVSEDGVVAGYIEVGGKRTISLP